MDVDVKTDGFNISDQSWTVLSCSPAAVDPIHGAKPMHSSDSVDWFRVEYFYNIISPVYINQISIGDGFQKNKNNFNGIYIIGGP